MESNGPDRQKHLTLLRNMGNHQHNKKVMKDGRGVIEVVYRKNLSEQSTIDDYVRCTHCFGWLSKDDLWKHVARCPWNNHKKKKGIKHVKAGTLLKPVPIETSKQVREVLDSLQVDQVSTVIKGDSLLRTYGERLMVKHGHDQDKHPYVRSKLHEMARLLLEIRHLDASIESFRDCVHPRNFSKILKAATSLAGYDSNTNIFLKPSLALMLGTHFVAVVDGLYASAIEESKEVGKENCLSLKRLFNIRWSAEFNNNDHRSNIENKKNTINLVPLTEDVTKLSKYLGSEIERQSKTLMCDPSSRQSYSALQRALLALVILFNQRHSGEVSRMKMSEYLKNNKGAQLLSAQDLNLSALETQFVDSFTRVEIIGKTVPVLLTGPMREALDLLIASRTEVGVSTSNPHVLCYWRWQCWLHPWLRCAAPI